MVSKNRSGVGAVVAMGWIIVRGKEFAMRLIPAACVAFVCLSTAASGQQQDFSKVEIKTTKLAGNFYMLEGSGGTIGVLPGPDGVFMVDTQFAHEDAVG